MVGDYGILGRQITLLHPKQAIPAFATHSIAIQNHVLKLGQSWLQKLVAILLTFLSSFVPINAHVGVNVPMHVLDQERVASEELYFLFAFLVTLSRLHHPDGFLELWMSECERYSRGQHRSWFFDPRIRLAFCPATVNNSEDLKSSCQIQVLAHFRLSSGYKASLLPWMYISLLMFPLVFPLLRDQTRQQSIVTSAVAVHRFSKTW